MQTSRQILAFTAGSANSIALSQTPASAGNLTLNGSLVTGGVATLPQVRRVGITSTGADTGNNFTITGTNSSGAVISETLAGPAANATVTSAYNYATVTSISVSAATAGAITVGTTTTPIGSSDWKQPNRNITPANMSVGVYIASGSANVTVEYTYDDPNLLVPSNSAIPPNVFPMTSLQNVTSTIDGVLNQPVSAVRATVNSGTGTVDFYTLQAGISQGG